MTAFQNFKGAERAERRTARDHARELVRPGGQYGGGTVGGPGTTRPAVLPRQRLAAPPLTLRGHGGLPPEGYPGRRPSPASCRHGRLRRLQGKVDCALGGVSGPLIHSLDCLGWKRLITDGPGNRGVSGDTALPAGSDITEDDLPVVNSPRGHASPTGEGVVPNVSLLTLEDRSDISRRLAKN